MEHCGWERLTDYTGLTGRAERSPASRKPRACRAARFAAFRKMDWGGFGSALRRVYPGSIPRWKPLETTTCPTGCRAMSSVTVVIKARMEKYFLAAGMGLMA